jgi:hypothetical protein
MTGMNALQLHQRTRAVRAVIRPLIVAARWAGAKSSATRGGVRSAFAVHRSGSLTKARTARAAAAGIRPLRKT